MQIIDSHQHFWNYEAQSFEWIDDKMEILKQDYLPSDLKIILDQNNVKACVSVQTQSTEEETKFLLNQAKENEFIAGVVGWLDICESNIGEKLTEYSTFKKLKGLRHIIQSEPDVYFMESQKFHDGIQALEQRGLTYDILIYPKHLNSAYALVKKFPNQKFVIDHIAKPGIKTKNFSNWKDLITQFVDTPNTYCKVSGMVTEADWQKWRYPDFIPYLQVISETFGPDRMMFGSDWPVCLLAGSYKNVLDIVKTFTQDWSDEEKLKLFYKNALHFYNLES